MSRPSRRFWFKLAKLWRCTVREAQERCDAREFAEWMAEYRLEPFGDERGDIQAAMICTLVANAIRGKGGKTFKLADFMPEFGRIHKKQNNESMAAAMNMFAAMHNATVKPNGNKNTNRKVHR